MLAHDVHEGERVAEVVGVVLDRLGDGLAHGLEAGEVDHAVDLVLVEDALERLAVVHVGAVEGEALGGLGSHDGVDAVEHLLGGVGQVVDDDDLIAVLEQLDARVGADEAGAAGDEDARVLGGDLLAHEIPFGLGRATRSCPGDKARSLVYVLHVRGLWAGARGSWAAPGERAGLNVVRIGRESGKAGAKTEHLCDSDATSRVARWFKTIYPQVDDARK